MQRTFLSRALHDERRLAGRREAAEAQLAHAAEVHGELRHALLELDDQTQQLRRDVPRALVSMAVEGGAGM